MTSIRISVFARAASCAAAAALAAWPFRSAAEAAPGVAADADEGGIAPPPVLVSDGVAAGAAAVSASDAPAAILAACASRMPTERVVLSGYVNMRRRYGVSIKKTAFSVDADFGASPQVVRYSFVDPGTGATNEVVAVRDAAAGVALSRPDGGEPPKPTDRVLGTDLTWLDAGFDFVWWRAVRVAGTDSAGGRDCILLDAEPPAPLEGCAFVRLWVDVSTAGVVQAEQFDEEGALRRKLWVRGIQKRAGRWVFKDIEVETSGTGHRTRLHFEGVSFPGDRPGE